VHGNDFKNLLVDHWLNCIDIYDEFDSMANLKHSWVKNFIIVDF